MGKVHEVFPLIIYQGNVDGHDEFKKNLEDIKKYWFNGYKYESPEGSERIFLHRNEKYIDFFSIHIRKVFDEYFSSLNIDYNKLSYHICKSWVVYHRDDTTPHMAPHKHNEANISFVYYLNTDETSDKFVVTQHPDKNINQVCQGFFDVADELNLMTGFNRYN